MLDSKKKYFPNGYCGEKSFREYVGYIRLVEALIYKALRGPVPLESNDRNNLNRIEQLKRSNLRIGRSVFVDDLCEFFDFHPETIRRKIFERNKTKG